RNQDAGREGWRHLRTVERQRIAADRAVETVEGDLYPLWRDGKGVETEPEPGDRPPGDHPEGVPGCVGAGVRNAPAGRSDNAGKGDGIIQELGRNRAPGSGTQTGYRQLVTTALFTGRGLDLLRADPDPLAGVLDDVGAPFK